MVESLLVRFQYVTVKRTLLLVFFKGETCDVLQKGTLVPLILSAIIFCKAVVKMFRMSFKICSKVLNFS